MKEMDSSEKRHILFGLEITAQIVRRAHLQNKL